MMIQSFYVISVLQGIAYPVFSKMKDKHDKGVRHKDFGFDAFCIMMLIFLMFQKNEMLKLQTPILFGILFLTEYFHILRSFDRRKCHFRWTDLMIMPIWFYGFPLGKTVCLLLYDMRRNQENVTVYILVILVMAERILHHMRIQYFGEKQKRNRGPILGKNKLECIFSYAAADAVANLLIWIRLNEIWMQDRYLDTGVMIYFIFIIIVCVVYYRQVLKKIKEITGVQEGFGNYSKSAPFVPKIFGTGYTINYRNPWSVILFIIILAGILWL